MVVVTSGVESEYVLGPLASYLRDHAFDVVELDFSNQGLLAEELVQGLPGDQVAYLTSAHPNLTIDYARYWGLSFARDYPRYLAPVELIPLLRPLVSVFVPHDLLTPFGDSYLNEYRYLDIFDYVLAPFSADALQATLGKRTRVLEFGWIKHAKSDYPEADVLPRSPRNVTVLFVSMIQHLRRRLGVEGLVDYFMPLIAPDVVVKLPTWRDIQDIEDSFRARGARVVPAYENSCKLIEAADLVICNSASSIHAEASLLATPAVCLLDDEGVTIAYQLEKLARLPGIYFHDYRMREPLPESLMAQVMTERGSKPSNPFDFAEVAKLLRSCVG